MAGRIRMAFSPLTRELLRTKASPLNPDFRTTEYPIISLIDTCGSLTEFHQIHALMLVCGLSNDAFAASRAVQFLASVPSDGPDRAILVFTHTPEPDAFTCNTIIKSLIKNNSLKKALKFYYHHMLEREIQPNHCTFPLLVKISSELKWVLEGEKNHCWVLKLGLEWDLYVRNSLVHMYSIFGNLMAARRLFDTSLELDIVSYNSMVDGYAKNGEVALAREMFDEMPQRNMVSWNSMVNGRAGLLCDFKELIGQMPMELGERIAKRVIDMEPQNIGPYLLLSHIYAANGRWDDVEKVRRMIKNRVSEEKPGCSLVEVDRFGVNSIVGDGLVHKTSMMYSMLAEVATHMKSSGS
ncbi:hypothetical protein AMTR_s00029p00159590 [Amborella trichopoda]|uniref:Pentatricopeptide repeat-containing protein n=1 Tax=Amborella trichopoda TaxID=13333 RepID=W1PPA6_AMBTC|nr:hypothetical protein AMTR_s00029p00159590 [Amborella trichopoda]